MSAEFQIGSRLEVFEASGERCGTGTVCSIDECSQSFIFQHHEIMLGKITGFCLKTGRETIFTNGIQDDAATLRLGRICKRADF